MRWTVPRPWPWASWSPLSPAGTDSTAWNCASTADTTPVPLGTGTGTGAVPLAAARALLDGFDGWVSLEWERTWYPHIPPVEHVLPGALSWLADDHAR
ncbi:hypothetical protein [Kitasatospora purpeofusca]|uniref:hypothetical protein n=1 Tax=Kitasatospora purpeofusca TaxID=67352 RepID=UPI003F4A888B